LQNNPLTRVVGADRINGHDPTGVGSPTDQQHARYLFKLTAATCCRGMFRCRQLQLNEGGNRNLTINGPGPVYGGTTGTINRTTLAFQHHRDDPPRRGQTARPRLPEVIRVSLAAGIASRGMFDIFNIFNTNEVQGWSSGNKSSSNFLVPTSIVPPRVMRIGAQITF
jgi:hypothetical protein